MSKSRDFLGPYRLARLIRAGTTSEVWEAIQDGDDERVALKVLRNQFRKDKAEIASLKHEFNVAMDMVNSPRIIRVKEYRVENGVPFLVMQLFSELNMKQALRQGPESLAFMLKTIVEQAAEGLNFMHTKNWIHRDVKPDNFLVSRAGETKLIDFTIAEKKRTGISKMLYKAKVIQGTRSYMAPEQIRGKLCDERTDVYSFGCVLYELTTGKPPYTGQTPNDLLSKHLSASIPSPIVYNDNVSKDLASLTKRMMAKKPSERPPSMWEFLKEFRSIELFKKVPRRPEVSVWDTDTSITDADGMIKRPSSGSKKNDEGEKDSKS